MLTEALSRLRQWVRDFGNEKEPAFIADLERVLSVFEEKPGDRPKTVHVRIAVAVNDKGEWNSSGSGDLSKNTEDGDMAMWARDTLDPAGAEAVHYLEAEVPIPASMTIPATEPA